MRVRGGSSRYTFPMASWLGASWRDVSPRTVKLRKAILGHSHDLDVWRKNGMGGGSTDPRIWICGVIPIVFCRITYVTDILRHMQCRVLRPGCSCLFVLASVCENR